MTYGMMVYVYVYGNGACHMVYGICRTAYGAYNEQQQSTANVACIGMRQWPMPRCMATPGLWTHPAAVAISHNILVLAYQSWHISYDGRTSPLYGYQS